MNASRVVTCCTAHAQVVQSDWSTSGPFLIELKDQGVRGTGPCITCAQVACGRRNIPNIKPAQRLHVHCRQLFTERTPWRALPGGKLTVNTGFLDVSPHNTPVLKALPNLPQLLLP